MAKPINDKLWYIVYLVKSPMGNYYVGSKSFSNKKQAQEAIKINYEGKEIYFDVIKGSLANKYGFKIKKTGAYITAGILKYDYPPESEKGKQSRKSFRTKYRRWKRDFNIVLRKQYAAK